VRRRHRWRPSHAQRTRTPSRRTGDWPASSRATPTCSSAATSSWSSSSTAKAAPPTARETIRVDGETVKIGAWLAKARTKHRVGQLPDDHAHLVAVLFDGDWTTEDAVPAVLA
jgi:hypothetical protein